MVKKTVGYVELEWVCPNCGVRNKGSQKICSGCGAAQPPDVQFQQPAEEKIIEKQGEAPPAVADVHCPFCGVRNSGEAKVCVNCGGDLSTAQKRESGQVLGAHRDQAAPPVACPSCGESNPAENLRCSRCGSPLPGKTAEPVPPASPGPAVKKPFPIALVIGLLALGVLCIVVFSLLFSKRDLTAQVSYRGWERSIQIEQYGPVKYEDWQDEVPAGAESISCTDKYRNTSIQPAPRSTEVCGTPYTVDQGDGTGQVVQDCEYLVYDAYCTYTLDAWAPVRLETLDGGEDPPIWPEPRIADNQRAGDRSERYIIVFDVDGQEQRYETADINLYLSASPGSIWNLEVNGLGEITAAFPED